MSARRNRHDKDDDFERILPISSVDGDAVGVSNSLIRALEQDRAAKLPSLPPERSLLEPIADKASDETIGEMVSNRLKCLPEIGNPLKRAEEAKKVCAIRKDEYNAQKTRLVDRQNSLDEKVHHSRATSGEFSLKAWAAEIPSFWLAWSSLSLVLCVMAFVATLGVEYGFQIKGLTGSGWGLVQTVVGAVGVCVGFTLSVIAMTNWRREMEHSKQAKDSLDRSLACWGYWAAWWSLRLLGLLFAGLYFDWSDGAPLAVIKALVAFMAPQLLAYVCIRLESRIEKDFARSKALTMIANPAIDALDPAIHDINSRLIVIEQIESLADGVIGRYELHIKSQVDPWISLRDTIRRFNAAREDLKKANRDIKLAEFDRQDAVQDVEEFDLDRDENDEGDAQVA